MGMILSTTHLPYVHLHAYLLTYLLHRGDVGPYQRLVQRVLPRCVPPLEAVVVDHDAPLWREPLTFVGGHHHTRLTYRTDVPLSLVVRLLEATLVLLQATLVLLGLSRVGVCSCGECPEAKCAIVQGMHENPTTSPIL